MDPRVRHVTLALIGFALACGSTSSPGPQKTAKGSLLLQVTGHDGRPLELGHVHLPSGSRELAASGKLTLTEAELGGDVTPLSITAVDHAQLRLVISREDVRAGLAVDVKLGTFARKTSDGAKVLLFDLDANPKPPFRSVLSATAKLDATGSAALDVPWKGGALGIQLAGVVKNHTVNGPGSRYVYDGGGDYISVVETAEGRARLEIAQTLLNAEARAPVVAYAPAGSQTEILTKIVRESSDRRDHFLANAKAAMGAGGSGKPPGPDQERLARLDSQLKGQTSPAIRSALMLSYLGEPVPFQSKTASQLARRVIDEVSYSSALWAFFPTAGAGLLTNATGRAPDYLFEVASTLEPLEPAGELALNALVLLDQLGQKSQMKRFRELLQTRLKDTTWALFAQRFDPDRRVAVGKAAPDFSFTDIDGAVHSKSSMTGSVVLVDFWATWCLPCLSQMPKLHELQQELGPRGFRILAINVDDSREAVDTLRAKKWPMPWTHVVLEGEEGDAAKSLFEVAGLPSAILIDKRGTIIGTDAAASSRENIEAALAR